MSLLSFYKRVRLMAHKGIAELCESLSLEDKKEPGNSLVIELARWQMLILGRQGTIFVSKPSSTGLYCRRMVDKVGKEGSNGDHLCMEAAPSYLHSPQCHPMHGLIDTLIQAMHDNPTHRNGHATSQNLARLGDKGKAVKGTSGLGGSHATVDGEHPNSKTVDIAPMEDVVRILITTAGDKWKRRVRASG
ncbi:hypothetical protein ACOSQ4_015028 [Xanthoceras sorbifolium]